MTGGLLLVLAVTCLVWKSRIGAWAVRRWGVPRVERLLARSVSVGSISVGWGRLALYDVTVRGPADGTDQPLGHANRVIVELEILPALVGSLRPDNVVIEGAHVAARRGPDGNNFEDVIGRFRPRRDEGTHTDGSHLMPALLTLDGSFEVDDRTLGVHAEGGLAIAFHKHEDATVTLRHLAITSDLGPTASAEKLEVTTRLADPTRTTRLALDGGTATLWPKMTLSGIRGRLMPDGEPGRARLEIEGGYGGVEGTLWRAAGWIDPVRRDADLHLAADRFTLDKLAPVLGGTPITHPERTSLETTLDVTANNGDVDFRGALNLSGLTLYDPWLAESPVEDLGFRSSLAGRYRPGPRLLQLDSLGIELRGVTAQLAGFAALPGGTDENGSQREKPRVGLHLVVPRVPCQQVLGALPTELTPRLQGFVLKGDFSTDVSLDVDFADLDGLKMEGSVGIGGCKIVATPPEVDSRTLTGEFEHFVEVEKDQWISFLVGPSNPDYVPLGEVSPYLVASLLTTEDSGFFSHHGFIVREFRSALIKNLKEGYFKYGASSITMQLVKNVLLYREKTLARKLQELFLTYYVESALPKERILEIYVNVIEFGPGIYGIGQAARHYFGKHARDLNPVEAAFFSSVLPSPKQRYLQYCEGQLSRWGDAKVQRIVKVMHERGRLTDAEYDRALATPLVFDRAEALPEEECKAMTLKLIQNARPTLPSRGPAKDLPSNAH